MASLAAFVVMALFLAGYWRRMGTEAYLSAMDFRAFYTAGRMVLGGVGSAFYDLSTQYSWQATFTPSLTGQEGLLPFLYPPHVALLYAPLALLPYGVAYIAVGAINLSLALSASRLLAVVAAEHNVVASRWSLPCILVFQPLVHAVMQGQVAPLLLAGALLFWCAVDRRADLWAGIALSVLLIKPQFLILPVWALLWAKRWRVLAAMGGCAIVALAVGTLLVGVGGLVHFAELLVDATTWHDMYGNRAANMFTWRGAMHRMLGPDHSGTVEGLWLTGMLVALVTVALVARRGDGLQQAGEWALVILLSILVSAQANYHSLTDLLLVGALVVQYARHRRSRWRRMVLFVWLGALGLLLSPLAVSPPNELLVPCVAVMTIGACILTVLILTDNAGDLKTELSFPTDK